MKPSNTHRAIRESSASFDRAASRAFDEDQDATREIGLIDKTTKHSIEQGMRRQRESSSPLAAGDVVLGRYEVQRSLGCDGRSTSYLARHVVTDRVVDIKVLDVVASREAHTLECLRRDARALGRIRSEHVVAVHDVGAEPGSPAMLVTDHIEGETVEHALAKGALGFDLARLFGAQMLAGLNEAHAVGIVHGNLTPRSVLIERTAANGPRVKVTDIGLSTFIDRPEIDLECVGIPSGTVGYLSPERLIGGSVASEASEDLYAVGVMLFAMLTGLRPFQADTEAAELNNVLTRPALRVSTALGRDVPRALERFMDRALAADREERFQSANEMRLALFVAFDDAIGPRPAPSAMCEDAITIVRRAPEIVPPRAVRAETSARLDAGLLEDETVALPVIAPREANRPATRSVPPPPPAAALQSSSARRSSTPPAPTASRSVPPPAPSAALQSSRAKRLSTPPPLPPAAMRRAAVQSTPLMEIACEWADALDVDSEPVSYSTGYSLHALMPMAGRLAVELLDDDDDFVIPPLTERRTGTHAAAPY